MPETTEFSGCVSYFGASFLGGADFRRCVVLRWRRLPAVRRSPGYAKFGGGDVPRRINVGGCSTPSRKVFEECAQPPITEALDEADYDDEPDSIG